MKIRLIKSFFALLGWILFCPLYAQSEVIDPPAVHGMVIFGKSKMYASHLPMYHSPHDYQVIFELNIDNASAYLLEKEQQKYPDDVTYTIEPEPFILKDMIEHPTSFKAKLFRGHFERGGQMITDEVVVTITNVIYAKKLTDHFPAFPPEKSTSYILFGNEKEQFAAHLIRKKPGFDQIMQISDPTDTSSFPLIGMVDNKGDIVPDIAGNYVDVALHERDDRDKHTSFYWKKQIYLEFTDLK